MKMVYAFIKYQGNSLAVDFPLNICDMFDHLGSIGIRQSPSNVTVADTKDVTVRLTGLNEVGTAIIGKLSDSDSLADIISAGHTSRPSGSRTEATLRTHGSLTAGRQPECCQPTSQTRSTYRATYGRTGILPL